MKGLAVSQIILLVLGIIVLAVIAYLLYTNFVGAGNVVSAEQCRAAATRACTTCQLIGQLDSCSGSVYLSDKKCADQISHTNGNINCNQYIGGTTTTSRGSGGGAGTPQTGSPGSVLPISEIQPPPTTTGPP
jgi:hypothetical protein